MSGVKRKEKGVITVFVSTLLISVLSFGTLFIEAGRLHSAKAQLAEVNISSAESVLSNYDLNLYQRYGILAYNLDNDTKTRFQDYIYFDSDLDANYLGNNATCLYNIKNAELTGFYNLTYPSVLKRQILSKSKYLRSSYSYTMNLGNMANIIAEFRNKADTVNGVLSSSAQNPEPKYVSALSHVEDAFRDLSIYNEAAQAVLDSNTTNILPSKTGVKKDNIPQSEVEAIQATLDDAKNVIPEYTSYIGGIDAGNEDVESTAKVSINSSSIRSSMKSANVFGSNSLASTAKSTISSMKNILSSLGTGTDGQTNLLLNSYLTKHCPNRAYVPDGFAGAANSNSKDNFVNSYAEYIFGGKASETENQEAAYWQIFYFRFCDNLYCIIKNYSSFGNNASKILWAYYESLIDMNLLTDHSGDVVVPITKTKLFLPINDETKLNYFSRDSYIDDVLKNKLNTLNQEIQMQSNNKAGKYKSCSGVNYAGYSDYISIALWFVSNAEKFTRLSDLIQLEMRYRQAHISSETLSFRSENCFTYCRVETEAQFRTLLPVLSIDDHGEAFSQASFSKVKYVGF